MMALESRGKSMDAYPPTMSLPPTPEKPLKRKSLKRLFSSSSRKPSTSSRPSSPRPSTPSEEELATPPTPQIPAAFWPLTPNATPMLPDSPRFSAMKFDFMIGAEGQQDQKAGGHAVEDGALHLEIAGTNGYNLQTSMGRLVQTPASGNTSRAGSVISNANSQSRSPRVPHVPSEERSSAPPSPALPLQRKRSERGLRIPSAFTSFGRGRGASVTIPKSKSTPAVPQLSRPSTSGADSRSMKPTGKRRQNPSNIDRESPVYSVPPFDDLPLSHPLPWQTSYSSDEVRASFRSAMTTTSSHVDTTSTERSSVLTKGTSVTDLTNDPGSRPVSKSGGMTVDDAIDMYAAGFTDEGDLDPSDSRDTSMSDEEQRRSMRIAEAINDDIRSVRVHERPSTAVSMASSTVILPSLRHEQSIPSLPSPRSPPTSNRDQYGFLKSSHYYTSAEYDAWSASYHPYQAHRTQKWSSFLRSEGLPATNPTLFPPRSAKTQRFIRKGIPPAWRGSAWFYYAGGDAYLERHPDHYKALVALSSSLPDLEKEAIERDLHRTFPDNTHFKPDPLASDPRISAPITEETPLLSSLRRVLRAFALHSPKIGYCQSLNFLAGLLLLFLPEEKAFWMLHIITTTYLPCTHEISLEGANVDLWVLTTALKNTLPGIWAKVTATGAGDEVANPSKLPTISLCATSWFMSLFIGTLPIESVLRVWDVLFYEGSRTLFRTALCIFKTGEERIKGVSDSVELFQLVQGLPRGMLDAGLLIHAMNKRGAIGGEWIERKRVERREWFARERGRVHAEGLGGEVGGGSGERVSGDGGGGEGGLGRRLTRSGSVWRRKSRRGR